MGVAVEEAGQDGLPGEVDRLVAVTALVFSALFIWYSRNTGDIWIVVWGPFVMAGAAMALGIPVYAYQRSRMTQPAEVPPYR